MRTIPDGNIEGLVRGLEDGRLDEAWMSLPGKPRNDVLYFFLVQGGQLIARMNIAGYKKSQSCMCIDGRKRTPVCWAVVTGPIVRPSAAVHIRGFRGFRYVYEDPTQS